MRFYAVQPVDRAHHFQQHFTYPAKMPPDPVLDDDDEQYASSEDSDFAPVNAPAAASEHSDSDAEPDADAAKPVKKRRPAADAEAEDAGYDNSGDEAIIERGNRRRKRGKADVDDDEGGEGGLVKTRRQRAAEYAQRNTLERTC